MYLSFWCLWKYLRVRAVFVRVGVMIMCRLCWWMGPSKWLWPWQRTQLRDQMSFVTLYMCLRVCVFLCLSEYSTPSVLWRTSEWNRLFVLRGLCWLDGGSQADLNASLQMIVRKGRSLIRQNNWSHQTVCRFTGRLILDILIKNCEVKKKHMQRWMNHNKMNSMHLENKLGESSLHARKNSSYYATTVAHSDLR